MKIPLPSIVRMRAFKLKWLKEHPPREVSEMISKTKKECKCVRCQLFRILKDVSPDGAYSDVEAEMNKRRCLG